MGTAIQTVQSVLLQFKHIGSFCKFVMGSRSPGVMSTPSWSWILPVVSSWPQEIWDLSILTCHTVWVTSWRQTVCPLTTEAPSNKCQHREVYLHGWVFIVFLRPSEARKAFCQLLECSSRARLSQGQGAAQPGCWQSYSGRHCSSCPLTVQTHLEVSASLWWDHRNPHNPQEEACRAEAPLQSPLPDNLWQGDLL